MELLELLELYSEMLYSRFALLDSSACVAIVGSANARPEPDPAIAEALAALIHAAQRTEVRELHILQEMLLHRYGREYAVAALENQDDCVPERVTRKLAYRMPPAELVRA